MYLTLQDLSSALCLRVGIMSCSTSADGSRDATAIPASTARSRTESWSSCAKFTNNGIRSAEKLNVLFLIQQNNKLKVYNDSAFLGLREIMQKNPTFEIIIFNFLGKLS
jgi:hypothetical protein